MARLAGLVCALLLAGGSVAAEAKTPVKHGKVAIALSKDRQPKPKRQTKSKAKPAKPSRTSSSSGNRSARRFLEVPTPAALAESPAHRYANLSSAAAYAELDRRGVRYVRPSAAPSGVRAPIRLSAPLHGVFVHSALPPAERSSSMYELLDARLALALDDFCALLERHEVVELVHYTMYRPGASPRADSDLLPTRHPGGLAIDVGALRKRDGTWLDVGQHWQSDIGRKTCGPGAKQQKGPLAEELVGIVCEAAGARLFHYMLTPHYDAAHHDHVHLEIKPSGRWFLVN